MPSNAKCRNRLIFVMEGQKMIEINPSKNITIHNNKRFFDPSRAVVLKNLLFQAAPLQLGI